MKLRIKLNIKSFHLFRSFFFQFQHTWTVTSSQGFRTSSGVRPALGHPLPQRQSLRGGAWWSKTRCPMGSPGTARHTCNGGNRRTGSASRWASAASQRHLTSGDDKGAPLWRHRWAHRGSRQNATCVPPPPERRQGKATAGVGCVRGRRRLHAALLQVRRQVRVGAAVDEALEGHRGARAHPRPRRRPPPHRGPKKQPKRAERGVNVAGGFTHGATPPFGGGVPRSGGGVATRMLPPWAGAGHPPRGGRPGRGGRRRTRRRRRPAAAAG